MKAFIITFILLASTTQLLSQNISVQGKVTDKKSGKSLSAANVVLIHIPDSTRKGMVTDNDGLFTIENVRKGNYVLNISYLGYATLNRNIEITNKSLNLGKLVLEEEAIRMETVNVDAKAIPAVIKSDTTEFNAKAFKTNPDATAEDLVTKLPGVTVQSGQVQAQGETVKQVLVDGKRFFGNDPTAALREIPADLISQIQIFDQQSERSQFSGFDDGNTSKTMNLITNNRMRTGQFGKAFAGYGKENEYKAGGNINIFDGDRRITFLVQSNNVNEQNFAIEDILGGSGGGFGAQGMRLLGAIGGGGGFGGGRMGMGGGMNDFLVSPQGGLTTTHAIGLNYSDKWWSTSEVSGSYFFNRGLNKATTNLYRQYVSSQNSSQVYLDDQIASAQNTNHRFNMRFNWDMDSTNSLLIRPSLTAQIRDGNSFDAAKTQLLDAYLNSSETNRTTDLTGLNASNEILFRHRFERKGRTMSVEVNTGVSKNDGNSYLLSDYAAINGLNLIDTVSLDQYSNINKNGWTLSGDVSYTEPISDNHNIQFSYEASRSKNQSDRKTWDRPTPLDGYTLFDTTLTNIYNNTYVTQSVETDYRYRDETTNASIGGSFQWSKLTGNQEFPVSGDVEKSFQNFLPNANLRWRASREKNVFFSYRTRTSAPSIDQLQNVINNTNPLQLTMGNPDLKQNYSHNFNMRYMNANLMQMNYFFIMLGGSYTFNAIANNNIVAGKDTLIDGYIRLVRGAQLTRPVNIDGAMSLRSMITYGLPFEFIKSNINLTGFVNYSRTPGMINGEINYSNTPSIGGVVVISSNISPEVDFTLSSFSTKSFVRNTIQTQSNSNYFTQNSRVKFNWIIWGWIVLTSDMTHTYSTGLSEGYNQNTVLWNLGLGYKFLPNNAGEFRLTVFDVLNQNKNYQRTSTDLYIDDTRTNTLTRYGLLTFTYTLRNFAGNMAPQGPPRDRDRDFH